MKARKIVAIILFLGLIVPMLLGAAGEIIPDDGWIGLGSNKGRIVFQDETVDEIFISDARFGIGQANPAAMLHVTNDATSTNTVEEVARFERTVASSGTAGNGIGGALNFYIEDSDYTSKKVAYIECSQHNYGIDNRWTWGLDVDGGQNYQDILLIGGTGGLGKDVSFYDWDSGYYTTFNFTGLSENSIWTVDLQSSHTFSQAGNLYVEAGEAESRINQDLTTDANAVFNEVTASSGTTVGTWNLSEDGNDLVIKKWDGEQWVLALTISGD